MSGNNNIASALEQKVTKLSSGFANSLPSAITSLVILGVSMTVAQIKAKLAAIASILAAVDTAREMLKEAVLARNTEAAADHAFVTALVQALKVQIGPSSTSVLAAFGIAPEKVRAPLSGEERTIATAKAKATRALRGTVSKKQKEQITLGGQNTVQVLGPDGQPLGAPTSSSASGQPVTPAPAAGSAASTPPTTGHSQ
jgi:hypothetical protein